MKALFYLHNNKVPTCLSLMLALFLFKENEVLNIALSIESKSLAVYQNYIRIEFWLNFVKLFLSKVFNNKCIVNFKFKLIYIGSHQLEWGETSVPHTQFTSTANFDLIPKIIYFYKILMFTKTSINKLAKGIKGNHFKWNICISIKILNIIYFIDSACKCNV